MASLLGLDANALNLQVTGSAGNRAIEFTLAFNPDPLKFSESLDLGTSVAGLKLDASGLVKFQVDPSFRLRLGVPLALALSFYIVEDAEPEVTLGVSVQVDDPVLSGSVGFLGIVLQEQVLAINKGFLLTGNVTVNLTDPGTDAAHDGRIMLDELTLENLGSIFDFGLDMSLDIDGLAITAQAGLTLGTLRLSLDGESGPNAPGHITNPADLPQLISRVQVQGAEDFLNFNDLTAQGLIGLLRMAQQWLDNVRNSPVLAEKIPFTSRNLGDVVDLGRALADQITSLADTFRAVAVKNLPTNGQLNGDASFTLSLNDSTEITVLLASQQTLNNSSIDDLVSDVQAAVLVALNSTQFAAAVEARRKGDRLTLRSLDSRVTSLRIVGGEELGFSARQDATSPAFDSVQEFLTELASVVGGQYLPAGKVLKFGFDFSSQVGGTIDLPIVFDLDLSPLASLTSNSIIQVRPSVSGMLSFGINLGALGASFTLNDSTAISALNGGKGIQTVSGDDLSITLSSGNTFTIDLDGLSTVGELRTAIQTASQQMLEVSIDGALKRLLLIDRSGGQVVPFAVAAANGSPAGTPGVGLGLIAVDEDGDGSIEGSSLHGESLADRFFIDSNAAISASVELLAPQVNASARLGFVSVGIQNGSGTATAGLQLGLNEPGSNPDGRITIAELFEGLSAPTTLLTASTHGSAAFTLPIVVTPNILGSEQPDNAAVLISWPDISQPGTLSVSFSGEIDLVSGLQNLAFTELINALRQVQSFLAGVEQSGPLEMQLPVIDRSIGDLIALSERFGRLVDRVEAAHPLTIQAFETALGEAIAAELGGVVGLPHGPPLGVNFSGTVLNLGLNLTAGIDEQLPVSFNLAALGNTELGNLLSLTGGGTVSARAEAAFKLDLAIDLSNPLSPGLFIKDTSGLTLSAKVATPNPLNFEAALTVLSVSVRGGVLRLDDGAATNPGPAKWTISLEPAGGSGRYDLLAGLPPFATPVLQGQVSATLPLFFPTETTPLGGSAGRWQ